MPRILREKLSIGGALAKYLVNGIELNTMRLIELFMAKGDPYDFVWQGQRLSALSMCLLAAYLLVPSDGRANPLLVGVSAQIEECKDVVPMVLAETLIGLDAVRTGQTRVFEGSPLLLQVYSHSALPFLLFSLLLYLNARFRLYVGFLTCFSSLMQMWLCNKIGILRLPWANWSYNPCAFPSRQYQAAYANIAGWMSFLNLLSGEDIFWRCLLLSLPDMVVRNMNTQRMVRDGLSSFTFYIPSRILCQLVNR